MIQAQFKSKKWYSQYKNGVGFTDYLSDFTPNLRGNQLERVKFIGEVIIYQVIGLTDYFLALENGVDVSAGFSIKSDASDFSELSVGDSISLIWRTGHIISGDVKSVSDDLVFFENGTGSPLSDGVLSNGVNYDGEDYIVITNTIDYLKYKWGFSDVDGENNTKSRLDGRTNSFEISGITASAQSMTKGLLNANDDTLKIARLSNEGIPENKYLVNRDLAQVFLIEHEFTVDDYNAEDIGDIETQFFPDRYLGDICQNYFASLEFRTTESAPESAKSFNYLDISDVGYFREKFNEGNNIFEVSNVSISRLSTGEELENISSQVPTLMAFTVSSNFDVFGGGLTYAGVHKTLLLGSEYEGSNENYNPLFDFENLPNSDALVSSGAIIKNLEASNITANSADFSMELHVGKGYQNTKYLTGIVIGDIRTTNLRRNTVTLPVVVGEYFNDFDVEGLLDPAPIEIFQRTQDPYTDNGYTSMKLIQGSFAYIKLVFPLVDGEIRSIHLVTMNSANNEVDSYEIDISSMLEVNGVQEIDATIPTPYSHGLDGRIKKVSNGLYELVMPYRVPFEKLNKVDSLDPVLFDQNEPNKGFNESVFYQQSKGLDISVAYKIGMFAENRLTYYLYRSPKITIVDFETNLAQ